MSSQLTWNPGLDSGAYRFDSIDAQVFDFALGVTRPVGELRAALAIEPEQLRSVYAAEAKRWPQSIASARLSYAMQLSYWLGIVLWIGSEVS